MIAERLSALRGRITRAAGHNPPPALVAVTKTQPESAVREVLEAGVRIIGENRVQEAQTRWKALQDWREKVELRLIGPLQTNKVRDAVALFDVIETLDRMELATALSAEMAKQNRPLRCLIQVNTGEEPQKSGIRPQELDTFLKDVRALGLNVRGLMCIPPVDEPPELHFALLRKLTDRFELPERSMGMSGDFESAIRLGATSIRLGSAIFGDRT